MAFLPRRDTLIIIQVSGWSFEVIVGFVGCIHWLHAITVANHDFSHARSLVCDNCLVTLSVRSTLVRSRNGGLTRNEA